MPSLYGNGVLLNTRIESIDLPLDRERAPESSHHPAIGADVIKFQTALLTIFQRLVTDLIAADAVFVDLRCLSCFAHPLIRAGAEIISRYNLSGESVFEFQSCVALIVGKDHS